MLDLVLAVAHHILIFGLFGILFAEFILVRPGLDQAMVRRVAATDLWRHVVGLADAQLPALAARTPRAG